MNSHPYLVLGFRHLASQGGVLGLEVIQFRVQRRHAVSRSTLLLELLVASLGLQLIHRRQPRLQRLGCRFRGGSLPCRGQQLCGGDEQWE